MSNKELINIRDKAEAIQAVLHREGFNEIVCEVDTYSVELEDYLADGKTPEEWLDRVRDYAIVSINPDIHDCASGNYVSFDLDEFERDFDEWFRPQFGPGVTFSGGVFDIEIEIVRKADE